MTRRGLGIVESVCRRAGRIGRAGRNEHGGATARVDALWRELRRARDVRGTLAERLRRGETIDGFGHSLYPDGDPRAALFLDMLPKSKELNFAHKLAESVLGEKPNLDFALVAVEAALDLPRGGALTLFAIGRTIAGSPTPSSNTRRTR